MYFGPALGRGISLRDLLPGARFFNANDVRVTSCAGDSRSCRPGDLFAALPGTSRDGHDYVTDALVRGVGGVLAERYLSTDGVPLCVVDDTRAAYGHICQHLAGNPSQSLRVVGVTGTNGKTTTTYLIASVLEAGGACCGVLGTLGYFDSVDLEPGELTTPSPPVLATWLARMQANGCTHAVVEVSSHALAQQRLSGVRVDTACFTNIRHDHLDFHTNWQRYRDAKARLLSHLSGEGLAIVNVDDPGSASIVADVDGPVLTVGIDGAAEVSATIVERWPSEQTFLLSTGDETVPVRTSLLGRHNVENCLVAAAVGLAHGMDLATVVRGIEAVRTIPGRLERIECGQPFGVFVDYAHTADALERVLTTLRETTKGRLICVFGAGGNRDRSKRPLMGQAVSRHADVAIITSDNPRNEDPQEIISGLLDGFDRPQGSKVILDRAKAIGHALSLAGPGDCVLIAGKGHEVYQICGGDRVAFDDREAARQWLYDNAIGMPYRISA